MATKKRDTEERQPCCISCAYARLGFAYYECLLKNKRVNPFDWCSDWALVFSLDEDKELLDFDDIVF